MPSFDTPDALIDALVRGELDQDQTLQLCQKSPELVTLALLAAGRRIAELRPSASAHPSTPSGMQPVYTKPNRQKKQRKPGARRGHPGHRRPRPVKIDEQREHRYERCPDCGGPLQRCRRQRTRIIEDIPENIEPVVTEHTIHRDYCPHCKKHVEPVVPDAMPNAMLGHHVIALTSWFHYGLGVTIDQVIEILQHHLQTKLTAGGLIQAWRRLAEVLESWYRQIAEEAKSSAHLHADETGWRVNGQTYWLWCFANDQNCYYLVDRNRGSPALLKFFTEAFDGVLITDFWAPYESVAAADRQYCLVHLLRELEAVDQRNQAEDWIAFATELRGLLRRAIALRKRKDFTPSRYRKAAADLNIELEEMAGGDYTDSDARRLAKRLVRYRDYLLTFLDYDHVAFENNFAERQIRPAVILRKNSQSNRSEQGAAVQAVLMSVYRTLRLRGHEPIKTITLALRDYLTTGNLPSLPAPATASG